MNNSAARDYSRLRKIGLSKHAVICYQSLANDGPVKVTGLSGRLQLPRTGLYRILDELLEQGFIRKAKNDGLSAVYVAQPINKAVDNYFKYQKRLVMPLLGNYEEFAASLTD